jgi:hypothetical protein
MITIHAITSFHRSEFSSYPGFLLERRAACTTKIRGYSHCGKTEKPPVIINQEAFGSGISSLQGIQACMPASWFSFGTARRRGL